MDGASSSRLNRRQFLVGGATGAAVLLAAPKLGWAGRASALSMDSPDPVDLSDETDPPADGSPTAGVVFSDNFDQEFPGFLLANWNVARPVLLVGTTQFGAPCPASSALDSTGFLAGHGIAVALADPAGGPGRIETVQTLPLQGRYTLSFLVAGSHHGSDPMPSSLIASVPGGNASLTVFRAASDPFVRYSLDFEATGATLSTIVFESGDAPGQAGLLIDDVTLAKADAP